MRVVIVGVGALGSHLVQFLRNEKVTLKVIDFDRVEQKNVASQFHSKPNVGKLKVDSLKQGMQFLYGSKIETVSNKLVVDNATALLQGDLIIDCLDNGAARRTVQGHVRANRLPCLHGALAPEGAFGRVVWDENFVIDDETGDAATCENGEFLPFIALTAAYMAKAAQEFLKSGRKVGFSISPAGAILI